MLFIFNYKTGPGCNYKRIIQYFVYSNLTVYPFVNKLISTFQIVDLWDKILSNLELVVHTLENYIQFIIINLTYKLL